MEESLQNVKKQLQKLIKANEQQFVEMYYPQSQYYFVFNQQSQSKQFYILTSFLKNHDNFFYKNKCNKRHPQKLWNSFAFFLPEQQQKHSSFVPQLLEYFYQYLKGEKAKIFLFVDYQQHIQSKFNELIKYSQKCNESKQIIYYTQNPFTKYDYPPNANEKIIQAKKMGKSKLYLSNSQLNTTLSHKCSLKQKKMICRYSGQIFQLERFCQYWWFQVNGILEFLPQSQIYKISQIQQQNQNIEWVDISIGMYQIDLIANIETNLFNGFKRKLSSQTVHKVTKFGNNRIKINFNNMVNQIVFSYYDTKGEKKVKEAWKQLKQIMKREKQYFTQTIHKKITKEEFLKIINIYEEQEVKVQWDGNQKIELFGVSSQNVNLLKKIIQVMSQSISYVYPKQWENQKSEIEVFDVPKFSNEFKEVSQQFSIFPIKQLLRIQNKILYKKYWNEKNELSDLNDGKIIKQMRLFHGTSKNNPQQIYLDKEESFNINYGNPGLAGRGIYFAEKAQYSKSYQFSEVINGKTTHSMFLCSVLVGDSQQIDIGFFHENANIKDTDFKDNVKKIRYQSVIFGYPSKIYVIYKSRRSYPLYLIKY